MRVAQAAFTVISGGQLNNNSGCGGKAQRYGEKIQGAEGEDEGTALLFFFYQCPLHQAEL